MLTRRELLGGVALAIVFSAPTHAQYKRVTESTIVDLTATVSMAHKQWWPGGQRHHQPVIVP